MGDSKKNENTSARNADAESLPELVGRLGQDITTLIDTKISLLKVEIKEDISAYTSYITGIIIGAVIAIVGFALFNVAVAFFISSLFQHTDLSQPVKYALGFIITAIVYLIIGGIIIIKMKDRMARHSLVPTRSVNEVEKDKRWIEREL